MPHPSVSIVMPAYNEADGIVGFLAEIVAEFADWGLRVEVVDDQSTDDTAATVERWAQETGSPVVLTRAPANAGHGPTTLRALRLGLDRNPDVIVAVDGDGQVKASDLRMVADLALAPAVDVVEGVRAHRDDPLFRRATSLATRLLVGVRARTLPRDANTPVRGYKPAVLASLLEQIPDGAMTPNLFMSALSRRRGLRIVEAPVPWFDRRGATAAGSTWGQKRASLPSKRFLRFCADATRQWFSRDAR